jgi:integrase/recombinase XerD
MKPQKAKMKLQNNIVLELVQPSQCFCPRCKSESCKKSGLNSDFSQRYICKICQRSFTLLPKHFAEASKINKLVLNDDVWSGEELGFEINVRHKESGSKFNFLKIEQEWLRVLIKKFIKYKSFIGSSFYTVKAYLQGMTYFSSFLSSVSYIDKIDDICRSNIVEYLSYLSQKRLSTRTQKMCISTLSTFLEVGMLNSWFTIQPYLIRKEDSPKLNKCIPRYIPNDVIKQLNQHLDKLPEAVMRMLLVIQEVGLRISELCLLPLDCLKQDSKGNWFIQFMRGKIKRETILPISIELSKVIREQQEYIALHLEIEFKYLFCGGKTGGRGQFVADHKMIGARCFVNHLKRLANKFNICDSNGEKWNFQTHQFRHTVGTSMINNGVPQHIIQKFLGHESPEMTSVYAHIHDATLRKEIDKYLGAKIVGINGEVIKSIVPKLDNDLELQWISRKILLETLSNGYCGLPAQLTCNKGNACLTCSDFRTTIEYLDQHKQHLERTNQVLVVAQTNGWERQIQINLDVKNSLEKIITTLEVNQDG